jgi:hypothetical protein
MKVKIGGHVGNLIKFIFVVSMFSLVGCAHRPVTLDELNSVRANDLPQHATSFEWDWLQDTGDDEIEARYLGWLANQSSFEFDVCVCIPLNESNAQLLIQGWARFRNLERLATTMDVSLHVNVRVDTEGPRLWLVPRKGVNSHGK